MQNLAFTFNDKAILMRGLAAFFSGLLLALVLGWSFTDLLWSLWLSSLVVGGTYIVWSIVYNCDKHAPKHPKIKMFGILFGIGFFMIHFGGFHFGHSIFLNFIAPIGKDAIEAVKQGNGDVSFPDYIQIFKNYFWILPLAFFANIDLFKNPSKGPASAYGNVVKIHLLIFICVGLQSIKADNMVLYLVTYAFFFFPISLFFKKKEKFHGKEQGGMEGKDTGKATYIIRRR